jgi:CheY-like chemotaxis protein
MGGGVGVDSQPGAGSTFFLQVTLASPAAARGAGSPVSPDAGRGGPSQSGNAAPGEGGPFAPTAPDAASGQTAGPLVVPSDGEGEARPALPSRALLVEDQPYNQLVARSILERLGYSVDVAATGAEARAQIEAGGFTLAVFDWDVPGAKGDELARFLRSQPNGESPIVLAATAHDTEDIRQQCFSSGMDGFLVKPLDEALIQETVHAAQLRRREAVGSGAADFKIFHYLGYGDDAKAQIAANEYAAQLEVELKGVSDALAREDDPGLAACAHRLRGHAAVVRFIPLKEAARRLQKAAKSGAAREALAEAAREVDRQAALLRELLKSFRAPASRG